MGLAWITVQLGRAVQLLLQLLGLARDQATAAQALQIQQTTANSELELINLTHGLSAAYDQRVDILSRLTVLQASVDAIPTGPQLATDPVILPTTPPTGYGGSFGSTDIDAIWSYQYPPGSGNIVGDKLVKAGRGIEFWQQDSYYPSAYNKYLAHHFDTTTYGYEPSSFYMPNIDPTTILPTDASIVAWLNRTTTGFTWTLLHNQVVSYSHTQISDEWWICTITQEEFDAYKAAGASTLGFLPPVWPGLDNVEYGTEVALVNGLQLDGPMHGVLVTLDELAANKTYFDFGGVFAYRHIGALSFYADDGWQEFAQTLAFTNAIYTPRSMASARGCAFRTLGVVSARVKPWTIIA